MGPPRQTPIGLALSRAAKQVATGFGAALAEAGGSEPVWLILMTLKRMPSATQREIAAAVGTREATLTHHLNAMERDGLVQRQRDPSNRRVHIVSLTEEGEARFRTLRRAATEFDRRLRAGIDESDEAVVRRVLDRMAANAQEEHDHG